MNPLKTSQLEVVAVELSKELEYCLRVYWGVSPKDEGNELVIEEMMNVIWDNYKGRIGMPEIRLAFKLYSLKCFDYEPKLYFGRITVTHLTDLLDEYFKYRFPVIDAYQKALEEQQLQLPAGGMEQRNKTAFYKDIKELAAKSPEDLKRVFIFEFYYERLTNEGFITLTKEEKKSVWERSKTLLIRELREDIENARTIFDRRALNIRLSKLNDGQEDENNTTRRQIIARKLTVIDWIESNREKILSGEMFSGVS